MFKRYIDNERGSIATVAAIGATVLLTLTGVAVEMASLSLAKSRLQDAADSAVLAAVVSGEHVKEKLNEVAIAAASASIEGNFNLELHKNSDGLLVEVSADQEMFLLGMFGYKTREISAEAGAQAGLGGKVHLALALDTTESMDGTRMATMISAATDLVDEVDDADQGLGNAKISLVPFADYVRIDMGYAGESWLEVQPSHEATWDTLDEDASSNCNKVGFGETAVTVCDDYVYETHTATISWNGCMVSRTSGLHKVAAFDGNPFKGNAGHTHCNGSYSKITPLTDNFTQLKTDIEAFEPVGKTYLPVGLQWAWRTLVEEQLFTDESIDESEAVQKVLLLMTDGSNTASLNGEKSDVWDAVYHWGHSDEDVNRVEADALTAEMCTSIKGAGIRLITVAYEVDDDDTIDMLKNCASKGADFYDAKNASLLKQAFGNIGSGLSQVRLTF